MLAKVHLLHIWALRFDSTTLNSRVLSVISSPETPNILSVLAVRGMPAGGALPPGIGVVVSIYFLSMFSNVYLQNYLNLTIPVDRVIFS